VRLRWRDGACGVVAVERGAALRPDVRAHRDAVTESGRY
jgi:hypothetical protein